MAVRDIAGPQGALAVDDGGPDPAPTGVLPVVLVHCDCGAREQWRDTLAHLRPTRRAVALDLRGHGASAPPADGDLSFAGRAADVGAVLDALAIERAVLVGHSGGGVTALHFAAGNPERVAALLLVDPAADGRQFPAAQRDALLGALRSPDWAKVLLDYYGSIAGPHDAVRAQVLADAARTPQATAVGTFTALGAYDPTPALRGYRGPRHALLSEMGDNPAALHRLDPTLPHEVVGGTGHWVHLDAPAPFRDRLDAMLVSAGG